MKLVKTNNMKFRVARHTTAFEPIKKFYIEILGLKLLGYFEGHDGYDGIFIGKSNADWHLEFTKSEEAAIQTFDEDDMLVFYPQTLIEYTEILKRFEQHGLNTIVPKNPYWAENGKTFADPDGYRIVVSPIKAPDL